MKSKNSSNEGGSLRSEPQTLDVILKDMALNWGNQDPRAVHIYNKALADLDTHYRNHYKTIFLELLGTDDKYNDLCDSCSDWGSGRNDLRAELRTKIEEKLG